jgi:hypothetical protein
LNAALLRISALHAIHFSLPLFYLIFLDSSMILTQKTNADPPQISQFPAGHFGTFVTAPFVPVITCHPLNAGRIFPS